MHYSKEERFSKCSAGSLDAPWPWDSLPFSNCSLLSGACLNFEVTSSLLWDDSWKGLCCVFKIHRFTVSRKCWLPVLPYQLLWLLNYETKSISEWSRYYSAVSVALIHVLKMMLKIIFTCWILSDSDTTVVKASHVWTLTIGGGCSGVHLAQFSFRW